MLKNFTVDQKKLRLDRFLAENFREVSRSRIQKDIEAGKVSVNGAAAETPKFVVREGDQVAYDFEPDTGISAKPLDLKILYENPDILIIDKPAGLVVHPAPGYKGVTLAEGLLHKYKNLQEIGEETEIRPGIVHRLDKDTSGVMLVAKTQKAFDYLKDAFANRRIRKEYLALLSGNVPSKHGFINSPIGRHQTDFRKMAAVRPKDPKEAITEYRTVQHFRVPTASGVDELTLVRVKLHTGRTHQIRVHFSSLGFPIIGDVLYGKKTGTEPVQLSELNRQFLHAEKIEVQLPDGTWIEAVSGLPEDLQKILDQLQQFKSE